MSGHSKWSTIKRKKEATDAKRGQLFSKLSKLIELAAKKGADPKVNFSLKTVVDQAKAANMPSDNIARAIKKGSGMPGGGSGWEEVLYSAYGPGGVAILIAVVTANKNKTVAELKHILNQNGANLSGVDSVKWLFDFKFENGEGVWVPKQIINLSQEDSAKLDSLLEALEENEDVSDVFTNSN